MGFISRGFSIGNPPKHCFFCYSESAICNVLSRLMLICV